MAFDLILFAVFEAKSSQTLALQRLKFAVFDMWSRNNWSQPHFTNAREGHTLMEIWKILGRQIYPGIAKDWLPIGDRSLKCLQNVVLVLLHLWMRKFFPRCCGRPSNERRLAQEVQTAPLDFSVNGATPCTRTAVGRLALPMQQSLIPVIWGITSLRNFSLCRNRSFWVCYISSSRGFYFYL